MTILIGLTFGVLIGVILGLTGAGGSLLAVPLLLFGLHLSIREAAPVALVAVGFSAAVTAFLGLREGIVRYRAAALIGVVGMSIAPLGIWLAHQVQEAPLTLAFAAVLVYASRRMFLQAKLKMTVRRIETRPVTLPCVLNPEQGRLNWTAPCVRALAGTGAVSGLLTGMLGVGGGFVIVPALNHFTDLQQRSIVATSLAVIAMVSAGSVATAAIGGAIPWPVAMPFVAGSVSGVLAGRRLARYIAGPRLQQLFAGIGMIVALLLVAKGVAQLLK